MTVWDALAGQSTAIDQLRRAVDGQRHAMSHAWLFTGPPGSGRSVAAKAFAAALQCADGGCGRCQACLTALAGTHPDVTWVRTEKLSIGVAEVRDLVRRSAMVPTSGRWQILVVEDADRVTEKGADALLRAIEEPSPRTVWMLCAPTADDVSVTIRSRCRQVNLVTPSRSAVVALLTGEGISEDEADFAARVSQGHIGRARALATNAGQRQRRADILAVPARLTSLGGCLTAAAWAVTTAQDQARRVTDSLDASEMIELRQTLGLTDGPTPRGMAGLLKDVEDQQALRAKRLVRDELDAVLGELTSYYRDVLVIQLGAGADLINQDLARPIAAAAQAGAAATTLRQLDAIADCRSALAGNVAPLLAFEALMVSLGDDTAPRPPA